MHGRVAFLPFIPISLKSLRKKAFEFEPKTVGEHILRQRLILRLSQAGAATRLGVDPWTVLNWEKGHTKPPTKAFPAIIRFLGYDPNPVAGTLAERLKAKRRQTGWTIRQAANALGVDANSWGGWERSGLIAWPRYRDLVEALLRGK